MTRREKILTLAERVKRIRARVAQSHLRDLTGCVGELIEIVHDLAPHALEIRDRPVGNAGKIDPLWNRLCDVAIADKLDQCNAPIAGDQAPPADDDAFIPYPIKCETGFPLGDVMWKAIQYDDDLAEVIELRLVGDGGYVFYRTRVVDYGEIRAEVDTVQVGREDLRRLREALNVSPLHERS